MYAVIRTGGKQYRVSEGDRLRIARRGEEVGSDIDFDEVLMIGGDDVKVGKPLVAGASVSARVLAHDRAKKIIVFKFKRRKNYRRKQGHRQDYTEIQIGSIKS